MTLSTVPVVTDTLNNINVHWSTGLKNHGIVTVQLSSESSDQALIAELITIRHLLFTRQIFGRKPVSGKGYELRVFSGAIKKIAQGRSTKEHIVRYGLFLTGPMFGVQIKVIKQQRTDPLFGTAVKENIKNTYQYIKANEKTILSEQHSLKNYDITIQVSNLLGSSVSSGIGSAVYIAIVSALYKKNLKAGLAVLGNISVGGAIERAINFADKITMLSENGAKTVVVPMDNLAELTNVPASVLGNTDVPFYQNNQMLMQKAILLD